jgi:hypothetical protein
MVSIPSEKYRILVAGILVHASNDLTAALDQWMEAVTSAEEEPRWKVQVNKSTHDFISDCPVLELVANFPKRNILLAVAYGIPHEAYDKRRET